MHYDPYFSNLNPFVTKCLSTTYNENYLNIIKESHFSSFATKPHYEWAIDLLKKHSQ